MFSVPKRNENVSTQNLYITVHNYIMTCNIQKVETTPMFDKGEIKLAHPNNGILLNSKKRTESLMPDRTWMDLEKVMLIETSQLQETTH